MRENYVYHTLDEVRAFAESVGCILLDTEYKSVHQPMRFVPSCGHGVIFVSYKYFRIGKYYQLCPVCRKRFRSEKVHLARITPFAEVKQTVENVGCKLHTVETAYRNSNTIIDVELTCGCHKHISYKKWKRYLETPGRYNHALICPTHYWRNYRLDFIKTRGCKLISGDIGSDMKPLIIECACGHTRQVTFNAFKHNGIIYCKECSNKHLSEKELYQYLKRLFPDTEFQKAIFTGRYQWLDFFIPSQHLAIEYHGEQHYKWCRWFHKTENDFHHLQKLDCIKQKWCLENGIRHVVIDGRRWNKVNFYTEQFEQYLRTAITI